METIRFALRSLWKSPAFSLVAILALALGIGANSAIFAIVNAIFLRPLPYVQPEQIVQVSSSLPERELNGVGFSWPRFQALKERQQVFEPLAVSIQVGFTVTGEGDPDPIQGLQVSKEFFPLLGVQPALGRWFLPEEDQRGAEAVAMLSHGYWQNRFGARADIVGKPIMLDGRPHTIVGVMPPGISRFPMAQVAVWTPRPVEVPFLVPAQIDSGGFYFNVLGRLKPGATLEQARQTVSVVAQAYGQEFPTNVDAKSRADADLLLTQLTGGQRGTYGLLFAAVGCVLLIACANVANLVLARYAGRRKLVAIRFALGAKRRHIMAQFIAENVVLALLGGLLGLAFAAASIALVLQLGADFIPRAEDVSLDPMVVVFTLGLSLLTGLVLGLIPALQVSRPQLTEALKDSSRASTSRNQNRLRSGLMVAEVATSFMLLIGASLLIMSFLRVQDVRPGFDPEGVFIGFVQAPPTQYPDGSEALVNFYNRIWQGVSTMPGAKSAALSDSPPLTGGGPSPFAVVGRPIPPLAEQPLALRHIISPNFFGTMAVAITRGRDFAETDSPTSTPVAIINETMAKQLFGADDPLGQRIVSGMAQRTQEIVGVVADMHTQDLTTPPRPEMYYPILQRPEGFTALLVRTEGEPAALAGSVRAVMKNVDPGVPLTNPATMSQVTAQSMADRRLTMTLLAGFAGLALLLASLGVYSVMAYSVGQRSSEIGVRMAMGARPADVQGMVVRQGLVLTGIGVAIGIAGSLILSRLMSALLFDAGVGDALSYVAISALLAVVAVLACWMPARRAARVDPMVAFRSE